MECSSFYLIFRGCLLHNELVVKSFLFCPSVTITFGHCLWSRLEKHPSHSYKESDFPNPKLSTSKNTSENSCPRNSEVAINVDKQRKGFRTWGHGVREPVNKLLSFLIVFNFGRLSTLHPASVSNTSKPDIDLLCCWGHCWRKQCYYVPGNTEEWKFLPTAWHFFRWAPSSTLKPKQNNWREPKVDEPHGLAGAIRPRCKGRCAEQQHSPMQALRSREWSFPNCDGVLVAGQWTAWADPPNPERQREDPAATACSKWHAKNSVHRIKHETLEMPTIAATKTKRRN